LKALAALGRGDSTEARRLLTQSDSAAPDKYAPPQWWGYRPLIAAHAWAELGENQLALRELDSYTPSRLNSSGLDVRWLLVGQARVLRGEIYERQGRRPEARDQYQLALNQWQGADSLLEPLVNRVKARLGRLADG
ncbi:MAG TPA: hypothetical protein VNH46_12810, partial [Gemmatimonadales bacterium]|nr:hypothetical protein [Gemmatimonadales bacterium]